MVRKIGLCRVEIVCGANHLKWVRLLAYNSQLIRRQTHNQYELDLLFWTIFVFSLPSYTVDIYFSCWSIDLARQVEINKPNINHLNGNRWNASELLTCSIKWHILKNRIAFNTMSAVEPKKYKRTATVNRWYSEDLGNFNNTLNPNRDQWHTTKIISIIHTDVQIEMYTIKFNICITFQEPIIIKGY